MLTMGSSRASDKKLRWELPLNEVNNDIISLVGEDDLPLKSFVGLLLLPIRAFPKKRCFWEWFQGLFQEGENQIIIMTAIA